MNRAAMPIADQIDRLRAFLRTLRADVDRASREISEHSRRLKVAPFVESLRWEHYRRASELAETAEECLAELKHARAIGLVEFRPGDVVTLEVTMKGHERPLERYAVYDVELLGRKDFGYRVWQLKTNGELFQRGLTWISAPPRHARLTRCTDELPEETVRQCAWFRERADRLVMTATNTGKLADVTKTVAERRQRRGY